MKTQNRSRLMLILSMVIFGTLGVFRRMISVSSGELALYRAVMAAALIGISLLISGKPLRIRAAGKTVALLLVSGVALAFNWVLLFEAYRYTAVATATLCYYFAPVLVTVISATLFREKMTPKKWLCFAMSTLGLALIVCVGDLRAGSNPLLGIGLGLGAAVLYACVILLNKKLTEFNGLHRTFAQFLAAIVALLPYVLLTGGFTLGSLDAAGWWSLAAVGVIHSCIAYCLYFSALKGLPGHETAILSYIDPLVAVVLSATVLQETVTPLQILGGVMVLGFTLWGELSQ